MQFPRRRSSPEREATDDALAEAREHTQASLERAHADRDHQRVMRDEEDETIVTPLRKLREENHFAEYIDAAFRGRRR